jgi:AhpD family alkylhydroperoxidase
LLAIAVALTTQCPYCIEVHRQAALKAGVTDQELVETVHVAAAIRSGGAITHGTHLVGGDAGSSNGGAGDTRRQ